MEKAIEYSKQLIDNTKFILSSEEHKNDKVTKIYYQIVEDTPSIIKDYHKKQEIRNNELGKLLSQTPVIFLMASDLDACAIQVPGANKEAVIAIGPRFCMLLHLMIRMTIWSYKNCMKLNSRIFQKMARCASAIFAYYSINRPFKNELEEDWFESTGMDFELMVGSICFVLCHELSHIELGHLSDCSLGNIDDKLSYFKFLQNQEYEADKKGAILFSDGCPKMAFRNSLPMLVCYTIAILDYIKQIVTSCDFLLATHPHGIERASKLESLLRPSMSDDEFTYKFILSCLVDGIIKEMKNIELSDIFEGKKFVINDDSIKYHNLEALYKLQNEIRIS